jgi:hypothetical protein
MNNIPPSSFPSFNGMKIEDLDMVLFEFDVLYVSNVQKLKLFPSKLKNTML